MAKTATSTKVQRDQREQIKGFSLKMNISGDQYISAVLHCFMCGKCLSLGIKSNNILLSNWTHHINSCKGVRNPNTGKITTLKAFFNNPYANYWAAL